MLRTVDVGVLTADLAEGVGAVKLGRTKREKLLAVEPDRREGAADENVMLVKGNANA